MNTISKSMGRIVLVIASFFMSLVTFAQEKSADIKVDVNTNKGGSNWYAQPWAWIIGGAVFVLLLVALLRNNSKQGA